jgi:subtilase family serine protease
MNQTLMSLVQYYNIPNTKLTACVGVISFGGGLTGVLENYNQMYEIPEFNPITSSCDVQKTWYANGYAIGDMPKIVFYPVGDAINDLSDVGSTEENILDCTMVGCVPNKNLTIVLFRFPISWQATYIQAFKFVFENAFPFIKPKILTCSWGSPEIIYSIEQLEQTNGLFQLMAANGFNICVATGDQGNTDGNGTTTLCIDFPSCCPYVISVGGSNINPTNETVWNLGVDDTNTLWATVGGYSSYFKTPWYQFQKNSNQYRSVPDVVMHAGNTELYYYGVISVDSGTSFSCPLFAGCLATIANLNQFVNPLLYSIPNNCFNKQIFGNNYSNNSTGLVISPLILNNLTIVVNEESFAQCNINVGSSTLNYSGNNVLIIQDNNNPNNFIGSIVNDYIDTILNVGFVNLHGAFKMNSSLQSNYTIKTLLTQTENTNTIPSYVSNPFNCLFNQCIGLGSINGNLFFNTLYKILNKNNNANSYKSQQPLYTNNAMVYYKPHSLPSGGIGSVKNSRMKARRT